MTLPGIQYLRTCPDPRTRVATRRRLGRIALDPLSIVSSSSGPNPQVINSFTDPNATDGAYFLPTVIGAGDMSYTTDAEGGTFPAGTLFVVPRFAIGPLPLIGTVSPYLLSLGSDGAGRTQRYLMVTVGLPAGSTGTFTLTETSAGTALATGTITGAAGDTADTLRVADMPTFAGFNDTTDTITVTVAFSTGAPTTWFLCAHPFMADAYAVPSSLPSGWTARSGAQQQFARSPLSACDYDWPGRTLLPAVPAANAAVAAGGFWVPETLQFYNFFGAFGRAVPTVSQTYDADIPPIPPFFPGIIVPPTPDVTLGINGTRKLRLTVTQASGLLPTSSFTYKITRSDTGATVANPTYTGAAIQAGVDDNFGAIDVLTPITLTLHVDKVNPYYGPVPTAKLIAHAPILPFPANAGNPAGDVAQGGISYAACTNMLTDQPTVLAAGVLTGAGVGNGLLAYTIQTDGWYQVLQGGSPRLGVGEDEYGYTSPVRTADRGRAGRLFYGGAGTTGRTLTAFVPSFSAIASGGTTLTTNQGGSWGYGNIVPPSAGTCEVSLVIANRSQLLRGLTFEWTASDPACINPDGREVWESFSVSEGWTGLTQTSPPGSPTNGLCVIVATGGTGAFLGHDGDVAVYNGVLGAWNFIPRSVLEAGAYVSDGANQWTWYDGSTWKASTDPVIKRRITVAAGVTLACAFGAFSLAAAATPQVTAAWAMVP